MLKSIIIAASLCADCFAVSLCSGVTLGQVRFRGILRTALVFGVIQTALLMAGWAFGSLLSGLVVKAANILGFLLLVYVGGGMLLEGIRGRGECRDLRGWRNVILCGVATSIDALALGGAQSVSGERLGGIRELCISVFVVTVISVVLGIAGGKTIGRIFGRIAEIAGGVVLLLIGIGVLL